jgi:acyl-[acyl-carrier-protein]-phospholipid O-acyltransferase/long-chain-fatty-acid--[acyl-carrier-protein] ligase
LRWWLRCWFGFRAYNEEVLQTPGPVLLVPNHVSWLDWLFVGVCLESDWKFVVSSATAETSWLHRRIMLNRRTFPVDAASPYAVKRMAEYLAGNGRLVLFAEGRLSRTGSLMKLFDGTGFLLYRSRAKIITCYLRGAQRVLCSPHPGWRKVFPRVAAHFGEPLTPPHQEHLTTTAARTQLTGWLRDRMVHQQFTVETEFGPETVPGAILEAARAQPAKAVLQDASLKQLSYRRLLAGADLVCGQLASRLTPDMPRVGVLLPNVNALPVTLLSLWRLGRVPAVLNYSTGSATMLSCAQLAGLRLVVTSRAFLERAKLDATPLERAGIELLYLEDIRARMTRWQKLGALARARLRPGVILHTPQRAADPAMVLFTSGSEGAPKAVELTHGNLLANVRQLLSVLDVLDTDRFFSALPLFHSFGLTAGVLVPLVRGIATFLYPSPLHYRLIPAAFYNLDCTVMFGTNTFLNGYARKASPYDFRTLRYLVAGAEKLQETTADLWSQKFGVRIIEGYGATECSPAISINTAIDVRRGSVGRLLPGIEYRLEPVEGVAEGGRLLVRGPNIMRGYLNPDANAQFKALGGWYDTGDIARLDEDGFVYLLGRLKRFAKVSGEMISLMAVEDALAGAFPRYGPRCQVAVLSQPDPEKGEALVAVTNEPRLSLQEIQAALRDRGFTNLCVPREIRIIREIPKLGTGKVNHGELARLV